MTFSLNGENNKEAERVRPRPHVRPEASPRWLVVSVALLYTGRYLDTLCCAALTHQTDENLEPPCFIPNAIFESDWGPEGAHSGF